MIESLKKILTNPNDPNFWSALGIIVTVLIAFGGFLGFLITKFINNSISRTTKILIQSVVEIYLDWVKVRSKSQEVSNESIRIWISENGGSVLTGRSYLVFKKFIKELKNHGYKGITLPDENSYKVWVSRYDGIPKWERIEW